MWNNHPRILFNLAISIFELHLARLFYLKVRQKQTQATSESQHSTTLCPSRAKPWFLWKKIVHWRRAPCRKFWTSCQKVGKIAEILDLTSLQLFGKESSFLRHCHNCTNAWPKGSRSSECCKDTSINVNIVFASVPCPFPILRSCCQLLKTKL